MYMFGSCAKRSSRWWSMTMAVTVTLALGTDFFWANHMPYKFRPTTGHGDNIPTRPLKWHWAQTFDMMDGERGLDLTNADAASTPIT